MYTKEMLMQYLRGGKERGGLVQILIRLVQVLIYDGLIFIFLGALIGVAVYLTIRGVKGGLGIFKELMVVLAR